MARHVEWQRVGVEMTLFRNYLDNEIKDLQSGISVVPPGSSYLSLNPTGVIEMGGRIFWAVSTLVGLDIQLVSEGASIEFFTEGLYSIKVRWVAPSDATGPFNFDMGGASSLFDIEAAPGGPRNPGEAVNDSAIYPFAVSDQINFSWAGNGTAPTSGGLEIQRLA